jgi:RNA polymerase-associated protein CTR9
MDPKNVEAMVGLAILDLASLDETAKDYRARTENAIRLLSTANLVDHSNALVQNHLANHYFWKWTPVPGTVSVEAGSTVVTASQPMNLDSGERVRIGLDRFESSVADDDDNDDSGSANTLRIKDAWTGESTTGLKLWKKDYDRVIALARGALSSTTVKEMQAESLFILARVHHIRDEMQEAAKFYDRACKLAPHLSPARFGLAQTLIWAESYEEATAHLKLVLGTSANATDALAALGLLEAKSGKNRREAFSHLKKAIDLDPLNPDLQILEALALQQQEADYSKSLDCYRKAVRLMESRGNAPPAEVLTNMGVLCHETKQYKDAEEYYARALRTLDKDGSEKSSLAVDEDAVRQKDNALFWNYVDTGVKAKADGTQLTVGGTLPGAVKVGDEIQLGDEFESVITALDGSTVTIKDAFSTSNEENSETPQPEAMALLVKRPNQRLRNPMAVSVAFNLARLHEAAGRIIPAVELHKTIVKRHPSYVNSYLRLACIARDCGSLKDCSVWLKSACAVAPGNPEVLTLVGNLHLSLCDWQPAQSVFDQLLAQKVPNVEAYSMLSLGNIYFNNLKTPKRYAKHLQYAADFYKRILNKDKANAYAANGLGTVLAEKADLIKAKETFSRVREVSGDAIPDTLLNLGHIYLAQKKHPEALQMYQNYLNRTRGSGTPISSKNQNEDEGEVLQYIAFAYFDWAKQTEMHNNVKAAPADERYSMCIKYLEMAVKKFKRENVVMKYNLCMTKLQAANCVLQKADRGIRRTSKEIQEALDGLVESLPIVEQFLQWKNDGKKVQITTTTLNVFIAQCKSNIDAAKQHLDEELKKEMEAAEVRRIRIDTANRERKKKEIEILEKKEEEQRRAEELEKKVCILFLFRLIALPQPMMFAYFRLGFDHHHSYRHFIRLFLMLAIGNGENGQGSGSCRGMGTRGKGEEGGCREEEGKEGCQGGSPRRRGCACVRRRS